MKKFQAWIGKEIEWDTTPDARGWYRTYAGTLKEIKGRNWLVDMGDSDEWQWFPGMRDLRLKEKT